MRTMLARRLVRTTCLVAVLSVCAASALGCRAVPLTPIPGPVGPAASLDAPRELAKVTLPSYVIESPDILTIEVVRWPTDPKGNILKEQDPIKLSPQPITGTFLVRPDGTVGLGVYGAVQVAGLTLDQARDCIKGFLAQWYGQYTPEAFLVIVDVATYNSKFYYIVTDGAGYGEQVYRFPVTGNETVLDAISQIQGLPAVASRRHVWLARRGPNPQGTEPQVMVVDWCALTQSGDTSTNFQVMPGDRIYVKAQKLITTSNWLQKALAPVQEVLGITLLGSSTYNSIAGRGRGF